MSDKASTEDRLCELVGRLAADTRRQLVRDVIDTLDDFHKEGMTREDTDTWDCGFKAAIEVVTANFAL